jgi:hypothetical protein
MCHLQPEAEASSTIFKVNQKHSSITSQSTFSGSDGGIKIVDDIDSEAAPSDTSDRDSDSQSGIAGIDPGVGRH